MRTPRGEHFGKDRIRAERSRFREVHALRVAPRATHEPVEKELGHIDQHQARQYLVRIHMRLQEGRYRREERSAKHAEKHHQRQYQRRLPIVEKYRQGRAGDCAHDELTLCADVPVVGAEADGEPDADQDQRRRLDREFVQRPDLAQRLHEKAVERGYRILAEKCEHHAAEDDGQRKCDERRKDGKQRRGLRALFEFNAHAPLPRLRPGLAPGHACRPSGGRSFRAKVRGQDRDRRDARR